MNPFLTVVTRAILSTKIYLFFCHQDLSTHSSFDPFIASVHTVCPTWNISQHTFVSNKLGNYVSCCRSCIYMSPHPLPSPSLFFTSSAPDFPNPSCWLSTIFNTLPFSFFTTQNFSPLLSSLPTNTSFHEPKVLDVARDDTSTSLNFADAILKLNFADAIFDPSHPVPELNISFYKGVLNGWFGIPFQDNLSLTHIRSLRPSGILTLYRLSVLIPFNPTILSSIHIRCLVLHILPLHSMEHISHIFLSHTVLPAIPSSPTHQRIINCFTLQPLPVKISGITLIKHTQILKCL